MSTPNYQGSGQPAVAGGTLLGSLGGLFSGGSSPAYVGNGQPSSPSSGGILGGLFGTSTPAYQLAPAVSMQSNEVPPCAEVDGDLFGPGPIAIVIPRQG